MHSVKGHLATEGRNGSLLSEQGPKRPLWLEGQKDLAGVA